MQKTISGKEGANIHLAKIHDFLNLDYLVKLINFEDCFTVEDLEAKLKKAQNTTYEKYTN